MSDLRKHLNENAGLYNAIAQVVAIGQRNQQLTQQREQTRVLEAQLRHLKTSESARLDIEHKRLELESARAKAEAEERQLQQQQAENIKTVRNFLADTMADFERLKRLTT